MSPELKAEIIVTWVEYRFFVAEYIWVQEVLVKEGDFWVRLINFVVENG